MGYVLKAVLSSAQHPEYGQITQIQDTLWNQHEWENTVNMGGIK